MTDYVELLNHSFEVTKSMDNQEEMSKLCFISEYIFDFITYDS